MAVGEYERGDIARAWQTCLQNLRADSQYPQTLHLMSLIAFQRKDNDLAKKLILKCLSLAPNYAEALFNFGNILVQTGDRDEAIEYFSKASVLRPDLSEIHLQLGNQYFDLDQLDRALSSYCAATENGPENETAHLHLGVLYERIGNLGKAADSFRNAIRLNPDLLEANFNLHGCLYNVPKQAEAMQCLKDELDLNPNHLEAEFHLGLLCEHQGFPLEAVKHFKNISSNSSCPKYMSETVEYLKAIRDPVYRLLGSPSEIFKLAMSESRLDGLILEFGVRSGTSIRQLAGMTAQDIYGFDSFLGLPEAWHGVPAGTYSTNGHLPDVPKNVHLVDGWFEHTLPTFINNNSGPVSFLNIDCDLYSSTRCVLELLTDRIVPGSVIVFDEYFGYPQWKDDEFKAFGEAVAVNSWRYEYIAISILSKQAAVRIT